MLSCGNKILQKVFRTFYGYYYLNGPRQSPTKQDHPKDALDQADGYIYILRFVCLVGEEEKLQIISTNNIS